MVAIVEPRKVLTLKEFFDLLDQKNPQTNYVKHVFSNSEGDIMRIYRKDSQLCDTVTSNMSLMRLPVVDKPLRIVIEARDSHENLTGALFCYHEAANGGDPTIYDERIRGKMYLDNGFGYYFSGGWGDKKGTLLINDTFYRPDSYDKDLLIMRGVIKAS